MMNAIQRMELAGPVEVPGAGFDLRNAALPDGYLDRVKTVLSNPENRDKLIQAISRDPKIPETHKKKLYAQLYDGERPIEDTLEDTGIRYIASKHGILLNNMIFAHFGAIAHQDDKYNDPTQYPNWGLLSDNAKHLLQGPFKKGPLMGHEGIQNFDHMFRPHINIRTRESDAEHERFLDGTPGPHPEVAKWESAHKGELDQFGAAWDVLTKGFVSNAVKMQVLKKGVKHEQLKRVEEM